MTKCNPIAQIDLHYKNTVNGRIQNMFGINFPKGVFFTINGTSFTKDGIAETLHHWGLFEALLARGIGLIDTLLTFIAFPFAILTYAIILLLGIITWVFLFPFFLCFRSTKTPFIVYMQVIGLLAICTPITLIAGAVLLVLSPLQIVLPELTCYIFQIHKWGKQECDM